MRAAELPDTSLGPEPPIGPDGTDAWAAVLSLHGDAADDWDDDGWEDGDPDTVAQSIGRPGERRAATAAEHRGAGASTESPPPTTRPGLHPAS